MVQFCYKSLYKCTKAIKEYYKKVRTDAQVLKVLAAFFLNIKVCKSSSVSNSACLKDISGLAEEGPSLNQNVHRTYTI